MNLPTFTPQLLSEVMEATWPPAARHDLGPFRLRDGAGGGKRVSAASQEAAWSEADLDQAIAAMAQPLFMVRAGEEALDRALEARGFRVIDPVTALAVPIRQLALDLPKLAAFPHWPPLALARMLWAEGGIGPERIAVMERVTGPASAILGRADDHPSGAVFVACHDTADGREAMLHALEVVPARRRQGVGRILLAAAAAWAQGQGAERLSLVVTRQNHAALALYRRAGMTPVGEYHYRIR